MYPKSTVKHAMVIPPAKLFSDPDKITFVRRLLSDILYRTKPTIAPRMTYHFCMKMLYQRLGPMNRRGIKVRPTTPLKV